MKLSSAWTIAIAFALGCLAEDHAGIRKLDELVIANLIAAAQPLGKVEAVMKEHATSGGQMKKFRIMGVSAKQPHEAHEGSQGESQGGIHVAAAIGKEEKGGYGKSHKLAEINQPIFASNENHLVFGKSPAKPAVVNQKLAVASADEVNLTPALEFYLETSTGTLIEANSKKFVSIVSTDKVALTDQPSKAARTWFLSKEGVLSLNKDQRFYACPDNANGWVLHIGVNDVCSSKSQFVKLIAH